jgi:hypothetical protein
MAVGGDSSIGRVILTRRQPGDGDPTFRQSDIGKWQELVYTRPRLCQIPYCRAGRKNTNALIATNERNPPRMKTMPGCTAHNAPAMSDAGR